MRPRDRDGEIIPHTRREYERKYSSPNLERGSEGRVCIYNPTIDRIVRGMRISVWEKGVPHPTGIIVESVDGEKEMIEVRHNIGGRLECVKRHSVKDVLVVWSLGSYEACIARIDQFGAMIRDMLNEST